MDNMDQALVINILLDKIRDLNGELSTVKAKKEYIQDRKDEAVDRLEEMEEKYVTLNNEYFAYRQAAEQMQC